MNKKVRLVLIGIILVIIGTESILLIKSIGKGQDAIDINSSLEQQLEDASKQNSEITTDYILTVIEDNNLDVLDKVGSNIDFSADDNKKLMYAYLTLENTYNFHAGVSQNIIETKINKIFTSDSKFKHQDLECTCGKVLLSYDADKKQYIYNENHENHTTSTNLERIYNKAISLTISNKEYKLTVSKVFIDSTSHVYSTFNSSEKNLLFEYDKTNDTVDSIIKKYEDNFEEYKDKITKFVYTFKKENSKFKLLKYEILA